MIWGHQHLIDLPPCGSVEVHNPASFDSRGGRTTPWRFVLDCDISRSGTDY